jgi:mannose-6-phosphate isomerase-like protein (cupin superfamily)
MTMAFRFNESVVHLDRTGPITAASNEPGFWGVRERAELNTGQILSVFSYVKTWDYQERHPKGDELALVLDGDVEVLVDAGGGETPVRLPRGSACIVPAGTWHRVVVHEPSTVLFVTPVPARTQHRSLSAIDADEQAQGAP